MSTVDSSKPQEPAHRKWLRLLGLGLVMAVLASTVVARYAHAHVNDFMLSAGSAMMDWAGERPEKPRRLYLNGAQLGIRAQRVKGVALSEVLDRFEARCRAQGPKLAEDIDKVFAEPSRLNKADRALFDGILRAQAGEHGAIACLDLGPDGLSASALSARVGAFLRSLDVADIGHLRYLRAQQVDADVQLVMVWSDGPLKLRDMFPEAGDAPGVELNDLSRPPSSRRILSAWEEGEEPVINTYLAESADIGALHAYYVKTLTSQGYEFLHPVPDRPDLSKTQAFYAFKEGRTAVVALSPRGSDVLVSIAPDGVRGGARVATRDP